MWNHLDKRWEKMTPREATLYKLGFAKSFHPLIDDWKMYFLLGPEQACAYAFDLHPSNFPYTLRWLTKRYVEFKVRNVQDLYDFSQFIMFVYPIRHMEAELRLAFGFIDEKNKEIVCSLRTSFQELSISNRSKRWGKQKLQ